MTGVVLCGGESSRMGNDKGMIKIQDKNWAEIMANNFEKLSIPFVVSINNEQQKNYGLIFKNEKLILDQININVKGPLLGLLSVHKQIPNEDLFVVACDMIDMDLPPLIHLQTAFVALNNYNAYLFETNKEIQPLCAIYTAKMLKQISNQLFNGELKRYSLKFILNSYNIHLTIAPPDWLQYFNNYNSEDDLKRKV